MTANELTWFFSGASIGISLMTLYSMWETHKEIKRLERKRGDK